LFTGFPVYVYIHGGGYGGGDGTTDISGFMNTNNNNFVGVTIQYRVPMSALGWLARRFADH